MQAANQAKQSSAFRGLPALPAPRPGWAFPQKQTLNYEVDWRVFPAGTASVHLESEGDAERVTVIGDSAGAINLLFRVSDRFQSTFNRNTGCSTSFSKQLMEGRRQVTSDQKFSYGQLSSTYDERNLISHIHRSERSAIPPCVTDLLSAMFLIGAQPLQLDQRFHIPVADAGKVTDVTLHVEAHEAVHTPTTTYQALRVQATADAGAVKRRGNIWFWYTDDARHIPVQMRARLFWGTITMRLTSIEQK